MYMNTCNWFHPVDIWHSYKSTVKNAWGASRDDNESGCLFKMGMFLLFSFIPLWFYYLPIRCGLSFIVWAVYGPILLVARLCGKRDEPTLVELSYRHSDRGWRHYVRGDYKLAQIEFYEAARHYAENESAVSGFARVYAQLNGRNNLSTDEYYRKGREYFDSGDFDFAAVEFTLSVKKDEKDHDAYAWRARSYIELKEFGLAVKSLTKAIELCPPNLKDLLSERYLNRGIAYGCLHKLAESKSDLLKALEINPENINARGALKDIEASDGGNNN